MSLTECWLLLDGHRRICWSTYHIAGIDLPHQEAKIEKKLTAWEETKLQQPSLAWPNLAWLSLSLFRHTFFHMAVKQLCLVWQHSSSTRCELRIP